MHIPKCGVYSRYDDVVSTLPMVRAFLQLIGAAVVATLARGDQWMVIGMNVQGRGQRGLVDHQGADRRLGAVARGKSDSLERSASATLSDLIRVKTHRPGFSIIYIMRQDESPPLIRDLSPCITAFFPSFCSMAGLNSIVPCETALSGLESS